MGPLPPINVGEVELDDIQGLVYSGYRTLPEAVFLVLEVADAKAAKAWLASVRVRVRAASGPKVTTAVHIALTAEGLRRLGLADEALASFPAEFVAGMAGEESRSRRLGDVGASAPAGWYWGGGAPHGSFDVLVMLYAASGGLAEWRRSIETAEFTTAFALVKELDTSDMDEVEPFGFADGLSQPEVDWQQRRTGTTSDELEYRNLIAAGEFVLGYRNEYGRVTDRPFVPAEADPDGLLPSVEGDERRDLGANGSYLVIRQLEQDVSGFWQFLAQVAGNREDAETLAERMVGRTRTGMPLVKAESGRAAAAARGDQMPNDFTFDDDPDGIACPLGAHIRRANPRNADMPGGRQGWGRRLLRLLGLPRPGARTDVIASSRFHRILRRGREYGPGGPMKSAPGSPVGLHFICLNANIARQFEFIQSAWLQSSKFDSLSGESDPLVGSRLPLDDGSSTDEFSIQTPGAPGRISGLPTFVTVRGGGYLFLPGLRALHYLASLP